jgi:hypothetical protein
MDRPHPGGRGEGRSEEVYRCYYVRYKQNVEYKDANENIPQAQGSLGSSGFGSSCGGSGLIRGGGLDVKALKFSGNTRREGAANGGIETLTFPNITSTSPAAGRRGGLEG